MCFSPQRHANFQHLHFKKWSETLSFFNILTSTCASRHSGVQFFDIGNAKSGPELTCLVHFHLKMCFSPQRVQFFDIGTAKSGPELTCFVHFHLKMCFSPQRRAIFPHRNFKKCSENVSFLAFWLQNALLATAACNFWVLLWPHDSAPAALTSLLFDSPDTRIIGKTQHFATSLTFGADESSFFWLSRYCIFFLLTLLHLLTLVHLSAFHLLFNSIMSEVYYLNFLR